MNYQPNLYVLNAETATAKSIYQVIKDLGFGKINHVERDNGGAYVAMDQWNMKNTASTRMKLNQGKPLLLYYSDDKFWKVYAYEHRFAEEEHKKRIEKKRIIQLKRLEKERQEKEAMLHRERKEKERKEKEEQLRIEREIDAALERFKQESMDNDMDEHEHRRAFDVDATKCVTVTLDYGNAREMYPAIKARAKKMFDKLKNKK
jgi:hypothetical protein